MRDTPFTGQACHCRRGIERDNCPDCEGTGKRIDFKAIRERNMTPAHTPGLLHVHIGPNGPTWTLADERGHAIAEAERNAKRLGHGVGAANAARVVLCWNTHDALVEALRDALERLQAYRQRGLSFPETEAKALAALATAGVKS